MLGGSVITLFLALCFRKGFYITMRNNNIMADLCQSNTDNHDLGSQDAQLSYPDGFAALPTVDWFSFTLHVRPDLTEAEKKRLPDDRIIRLSEAKSISLSDSILSLKLSLAKYFGGGVLRPCGGMRYKSSMSILGTGLILWHEDRPEMGVHVSLPSTALARHAQIVGGSVYDLLRDMHDRGAVPARFDLALDSDAVSMSDVIDSFESGLLVTKAQKHNIIQDYQGNRPVGGKTLYIGRRQGRRMVRFYDKAAKEGVAGVWTRCEVEFKHEHAITAVKHILAGSDPRELVLASVDFRLDPDNNQTDRRTRCDWWQDWVGVTSRVTFPIAKEAATVADAMAWIVGQVTPTLSFLSMYMGNTYWLDNLIADATKRVPDWKWDLLPDHRFRFAPS